MNGAELRYKDGSITTRDAAGSIDIRCEGAYIPVQDVSSASKPSVLWKVDGGNDIIKGDSGDVSG